MVYGWNFLRVWIFSCIQFGLYVQKNFYFFQKKNFQIFKIHISELSKNIKMPTVIAGKDNIWQEEFFTFLSVSKVLCVRLRREVTTALVPSPAEILFDSQIAILMCSKFGAGSKVSMTSLQQGNTNSKVTINQTCSKLVVQVTLLLYQTCCKCFAN